MPTAEKEFVLKHTFKDVSKMKEGEHHYSNREEHFGVPWQIEVYHKENHLAIHLHCSITQTNKWSMDADREFKLLSVTGKEKALKTNNTYGNSENQGSSWGWLKFISWESLIKEYVVDDCLMVEISVKIKKMTGIDKKNLLNFDNSIAELSDVVFVVKRQKFYVSKFYLARQSAYFKTLLLGRFKESRMSEIKLDGIEPKDFQNFLEVLYLAPAIDDNTIDGILKLADMYVSDVVVKKCEEFLLEKSEKSIKEKLKLAVKYKFDTLKNHVLLKINNVSDVRSILPGDLSSLDSSVTTALLQKCIGFK